MKTSTILFALVWMSFNSLFAQAEEPVPIPGQYIVTLKESAAKPVALAETTDGDRAQKVLLNEPKRTENLSKLALVRRAANVADGKVIAEFADAIVGFSANLSAAEVAQLSANPDVEGVYPDYYIQLDATVLEERPGEYEAAGQTVPCAVKNAGGFKKYTGENWIWILDTGIDIDHPDLTVGDIFPYAKSFIPGETYDDGNGHGTHVAGIAGAKNNTFGIVGVSAGALLIPLKVLANNGMASLTYVIQGLNHVAIYDSPNDVVNLSLGSYPVTNCVNNNPALKAAILNVGTGGSWVCIAAGNNAGKASMCSPGCINGTKIFTVGGTTCSGDCFTSSNWGASVVDWVATGVNVYSTYKNGGYATMSGTSQATPVVSGIIHARGGPPVTGGTVTCGNLNVPTAAYKIAKRI
ncbi:MAG: S8 family serine peptidase [Saprospiraceae bacterium]|nr:S8 family serine peptidase [Saprospiraceae bacterium]